MTRPTERRGPHGSTGFHLWHVTLQWKAAVTEALAPHGLTSTQFFVLGAIGWTLKSTSAKPSQREVAQLSGSDPMTTSQVVRALVSSGLVQRVDDPQDTRTWRLTLTDKGLKTLKESALAVQGAEARFFKRLGPGEAAFKKALTDLNRRV